jgi:hypothetical protein
VANFDIRAGRHGARDLETIELSDLITDLVEVMNERQAATRVVYG